MKTVVVIPVYNEEAMIAGVVAEARRHCDAVVVVDDCSKDNTAEVARGLGVTYVRHAENMGQGASTRTGVEVALLLGADVIVTMDGDGQHDASQIPLLIEPLTADSQVDIVMGSRFLKGSNGSHGVPRYRKLGIDLITRAYNLGQGQKVSDSLLCFRAFRRRVFERITITENGFGFCPEMLVKARSIGFRIAEVPTHCIYHADYRLNSTFSPIRLASILVWKVMLWRWRIER